MSKAPWKPNGMAIALRAVSFTGHLGSIPSQGADKPILNNTNMVNENCIFCKIIKGEIPSAKVWEDSEFISIADIKPVGEGHTLVIPKKHFATLMDVDEYFSKKYIDAIKKTASILMKKYKANGFNSVLNNGEEAGQIVNHVHFHILPRKKGDGFRVFG